MSPSWFIYYGLQVGLTLDETLDLPFGELLDLINIHRIVNGFAKEKREISDDDIIPDID